MDVIYKVINRITLYITSIKLNNRYVPFIPNINLTKPFRNFGTLFTTIVIIFTLPYQLASQTNPKIVKATPIENSQPVTGSNKTSNIPKPIPIKQTPKVFFNIPNIILLPPHNLLYYVYKTFVTKQNVKLERSNMTKKETTEIIEILKKFYPEAKCSLNFNSPFELAIAVMLSAQCTDERVNKVTPFLFSKYSTPTDFINAPISDIQQIIYPCGFSNTKSQNIKKMAEIIHEKFNDNLPNTMNELISLPGIGRKSANVIMLDAFNNPQGIAVDTHVKRISTRIGLSKKIYIGCKSPIYMAWQTYLPSPITQLYSLSYKKLL